jgi:hypothetical protein
MFLKKFKQEINRSISKFNLFEIIIKLGWLKPGLYFLGAQIASCRITKNSQIHPFR